MFEGKVAWSNIFYISFPAIELRLLLYFLAANSSDDCKYSVMEIYFVSPGTSSRPNIFTIPEPHNPWIDVFELHKIRQSPDFDDLKLRKFRSGCNNFAFRRFFVPLINELNWLIFHKLENKRKDFNPFHKRNEVYKGKMNYEHIFWILKQYTYVTLRFVSVPCQV